MCPKLGHVCTGELAPLSWSLQTNGECREVSRQLLIIAVKPMLVHHVGSLDGWIFNSHLNLYRFARGKKSSKLRT